MDPIQTFAPRMFETPSPMLLFPPPLPPLHFDLGFPQQQQPQQPMQHERFESPPLTEEYSPQYPQQQQQRKRPAQRVEEKEEEEEEVIPQPPEPWRIEMSRSRKRKYYFNPVTEQSIWPNTDAADALFVSRHPQPTEQQPQQSQQPEEQQQPPPQQQQQQQQHQEQPPQPQPQPQQPISQKDTEVASSAQAEPAPNVLALKEQEQPHQNDTAELALAAATVTKRKAAALKLFASVLSPELCRTMGLQLTEEVLKPLRACLEEGDASAAVPLALLQYAIDPTSQPNLDRATLLRYELQRQLYKVLQHKSFFFFIE